MKHARGGGASGIRCGSGGAPAGATPSGVADPRLRPSRLSAAGFVVPLEQRFVRCERREGGAVRASASPLCGTPADAGKPTPVDCGSTSRRTHAMRLGSADAAEQPANIRLTDGRKIALLSFAPSPAGRARDGPQVSRWLSRRTSTGGDLLDTPLHISGEA